jgi:hypothetical protein
MLMNAEQKKHLRGRLNDVAREHLHGQKELREPVAVKRARAIVRKFNDKTMRITDVRRNAIRKAEEKVKQVVLFGTANEALTALAAFSKQKFKK